MESILLAALLKAIASRYPNDRVLDIMNWMDQCRQCGVELTIAEYEQWRKYDGNGNLKPNSIN